MRLTCVLLLAASLATPAVAQQIIIQGPQPGKARQADRAAGMENREARQDTTAARREEGDVLRDLSRGNLGGAAREESEAQRDLRAAQGERNEARKDLNRGRRDEELTIRVR